jgi:hypothetical protein
MSQIIRLTLSLSQVYPSYCQPILSDLYFEVIHDEAYET